MEMRNVPSQTGFLLQYIYMACVILFVVCTGCTKKNDPTLQCYIFKDIEFDVLKFSTVIQHGLK